MEFQVNSIAFYDSSTRTSEEHEAVFDRMGAFKYGRTQIASMPKRNLEGKNRWVRTTGP
jgi:hypothetical protein